jgi:small subunit ribosomal protein S17
MTGQQTEQAAAPEATAPVRKSLAQTFVGRVVSDKMNKTVTVLVERRVKHPLYGKIVMQSRKFHAHDENNECKTGDLVEIAATRKLSKTKAWRVANILEKAQIV